MRLDLTRAFVTDGFEKKVEYEADLSPYSDMLSRHVSGSKASVSGRLFNRAGVLCLELAVRYEIAGVCDRCCEPVTEKRTAEVSVVLVKELQNQDSDVLVLVDSDFFETDGLVAEAVMLDMPSKLLCSEGCKGLCPVCGQNLNVKKCDCKKRQSPFDILKQEYNG